MTESFKEHLLSQPQEPVDPAENEAVVVRHSFDGYGWKYIDAGSGSDWFKRGMSYPDAEPLYEHASDQDYIDVSSEGVAELVHPDDSREPAPEGWENNSAIKATRVE